MLRVIPREMLLVPGFKAAYGALTVTAEQVVPLRVDSAGRVLMERSA